MAEASTTAEVVKQVLDKLTEGAKAAQTTVEAALPHVVRAYMARQLGYFLAASLLAALGGVIMWKASRRPMITKQGHETVPTVALFVVIGAGICTAIGLGIAFGNLGETLGVLADPTGMFILDLIKR